MYPNSLEMKILSEMALINTLIWAVMMLFLLGALVWVLVLRKPGPHRYEEVMLDRDKAIDLLQKGKPLRVIGENGCERIIEIRHKKISLKVVYGFLEDAEEELGLPCLYTSVIDRSES